MSQTTSTPAIRTAVTPRREEDYPEWYQAVVKAADLAEQSPVRGCMVIKPWGYGIWERMQRTLDARIKALGHDNAYFPLFIPLSFLEKEAAHVEGFAKECAVVTHHRLEAKDGKLIPTGELDEPLVVRPTSETIIGESFSRWVQSYRDLPLLINQWANVVRWELRTRMFLRTTEFLWQEGHTAHATADEAKAETMTALEMYRWFAEEQLAVPVIVGEKSPRERFPGAEQTFSIEAMMQDRKALQAGTSHYLGQNFAKASQIRFLDAEGQLLHAHTTSWGASTRLIGALIMTHADDDGLRVPPRVAPKQVVIIPVIKQESARDQVMQFVEALAADLSQLHYNGESVLVHLDRRDIASQDKKWQWVKRGVPLRIEVGPRDIAAGTLFVARRDQALNQAAAMRREDLVATLPQILEEIQNSLYEQARAHRAANLHDSIADFAALESFFTPRNLDKPEIHGGFVRAKWCGKPECEDRIASLTVTIRCLPLEQSGTTGTCIACGESAVTDAILAKAY